MNTVFDHVAIAAETREAGRAWFQAKTGIELPLGGEHPLMSTHNCVTATGNNGFFELIAIDPDAPAPGRPRWFGLDAFSGAPRPAAWIVGVEDIEAKVAALAALDLDVGEVLALSRGDLSWKLTVRADGQVPLGGTLPQLIEWPAGPHPSGKMKDVGLRLERVTLHSTNPDLLQKALSAIGADQLATIAPSEEDRLEVKLNKITL